MKLCKISSINAKATHYALATGVGVVDGDDQIVVALALLVDQANEAIAYEMRCYLSCLVSASDGSEVEQPIQCGYAVEGVLDIARLRRHGRFCDENVVDGQALTLVSVEAALGRLRLGVDWLSANKTPENDMYDLLVDENFVVDRSAFEVQQLEADSLGREE